MAFSGGTFSRTFDCTTDRDNGVKILASKFDTELDGFATGLSTCILKDGTQTCTAAIPFAEGLTVPDNKTIVLGTNSDITIQYDESTNDSLEIAANVEGAALGIVLKADQGDDNADQHKLNIADGGVLTLGSKISGSFVNYLTHTPNSTVASSTTAVAGNLTVGGDLTLGSGAVISEAELEAIDGVTAGTVTASKAVIVDSNKDIASFRNVTLTGELDAGSLDISGDADIDGTLEADAMTLNGTAITATATLNTGISNNNVPKFTSGVVDDDFLRVAGTAIEGRSASEVLSDIGAAPAAGSSNIVTTGALNSGSITSGFGSIDNGSSAITTTGVITGGSLDINGAANINSGTTDNALTVVSTDAGVNIVLTDNTTSMAVGNSAGTFQLYGDTSSFPKLISASNSAVVINEDSNDTDFRVESNGNANMLFVDAGNDRVGIGTTGPTRLLSLNSSNASIDFSNGTWTNEIINSAGQMEFRADHTNAAAASLISFSVDGSEAMRINSSNTVMVGRTATGYSNTGSQFTASGAQNIFVADGDYALGLGRNSSDGTIQEFRKDGTTVGVISVFGADMYIGTDDAGLTFNNSVDLIAPVNPTTGATRDNAIDLGASNARFKDLYLSGTAYVDTAVEIRAGLPLKLQNVAGNGFATIQNAGAGTNTDLSFNTAGSEAMRITNGGSVGIGTANITTGTLGSSNRFLEASAGTANGSGTLVLSRDTSANDQEIGGIRFANQNNSTDGSNNNTGKLVAAISGRSVTTDSNAGDDSGGVLVFNTKPETGTLAERMRVDGANLLVGTTNATGDGGGLELRGNTQNGGFVQIKKTSSSSSGDKFMQFARNGSVIGSVSMNGTTAVTYATSSDHRLKEAVVDMTGAIDRVKALAPKRFNFIADPDITVDGFLAHEAQAVVPEAITGTHNEVETWTQQEIDDGDAPDGTSVGDNKLDGDGNTIPVMQGIDQSKLVPLLTGALQQAIAKIETLETQRADLETRLTALEGA